MESTRLARASPPRLAPPSTASYRAREGASCRVVRAPPRRKQRLFREALSSARSLDSATRRCLLSADEFVTRDDHTAAVQHLEAGLSGARGHSQLQSLVWALLADQHTAAGHFRKASVCLVHHLAFCREIGDFPGLTKAQCRLGIAYLKLGLLKLAGRCFLQYLGNCRLLNDGRGTALAYSNLGVLSKMLALRDHGAALAEGDRLRAKEAMRVHLRRSIAYFEHHLDLVERQEDIEMQGRCYGNLGMCHEMLQEIPQAIFCHSKRVETVRLTGDMQSEACALYHLGNCFRAIGRLEEALEYYLLNLELTRATSNGPGEAVTLLCLGITTQLMGHLDKAIEWHTLYLSLVVERGDLIEQARAYVSLASLYQKTGQLTKAREHYQHLLPICKQLGDAEAQAAAHKYLEGIQWEIKKKNLLQKKTKKIFKQNGHVLSPNITPPQPPSHEHRTRSWAPPTLTPPTLPHHTPTITLSHNPLDDGTSSLDSWLLFDTHSALERNQVTTSSVAARQPFEQAASQPNSAPFYMLGDIMRGMRDNPSSRCESPLPKTPSNGGSDESLTTAGRRDDVSLTDYECMSERHLSRHPSRQVSRQVSVLSVSHPRHLEALRSVGRDLVGGSLERDLVGGLLERDVFGRALVDVGGPVTEEETDGTDKEWEQWLTFQEAKEDGAPCEVGSLDALALDGHRLHAGAALRINVSAPQSLSVMHNEYQVSPLQSSSNLCIKSAYQATAL